MREIRMLGGLLYAVSIVNLGWCLSEKNGVVTYTSDDVLIVSGTPNCISNCSYQRTENTSVLCSIQQCVSPQELGNSESTSQKIEIKDVHLEKYSTNSGNDKLAFHIEWSPIGTVLGEHYFGYKINIFNNNDPYSTCYTTGTIKSSNESTKDTFYNNCFGRTFGYIKPQSTITVHITPFPFNQDPTPYTRILHIQVPGCSNEMLHSLKECEILGGRPTSRPCITNCSTHLTTANIDDVKTTHHVRCSIPEQQSLTPHVICDPRNVTGVPSAPKWIDSGQQWYKFIDSETKEVKIALNFTWQPNTDSSITQLAGYKIEITKGPAAFGFAECFDIHTNLEVGIHDKATFYYDCYGRGTDEVKSDSQYNVAVYSSPQNGLNFIRFSIKIPTCADPRLQDVTECIDQTSRKLEIITSEVYCGNRSLKISYNATREFGDVFDISFCESGTSVIQKCAVELESVEKRERIGNIYEFALPSHANLSIGYTVFIHARSVDYRNYTHPDFSVCIPATSTTLAVLITICAIIAFILIIFLIWFFFFRDRCGFWIFKKLKSPRPEYHISARHPPEDTDDIPITLPKTATVYVVFADDHELHRNVVHWFCSFLQHDLGLKVKIHIWEQNTAAFSRPQYIIKNLQEADRVLVICSEGSNECLVDLAVGNMYAPVVRQLCVDSLAGKNPEKYIVAYFSYTDPKHIPNMLRSHIETYSPAFKLMDQLEQFYFRLIGVDQYQEKGILKIDEVDQFFATEKRTNSVITLQDAISKMTTLTTIHPSWYQDFKQPTPAGVVQEPQAQQIDMPVESITGDFYECQPSITRLLPSTPPKLHEKPAKNIHTKINDNHVQQNMEIPSQRAPIQAVPAYQLPQNSVHRVPRQNNDQSVSYQVQNEALVFKPAERQPSEHTEKELCQNDSITSMEDSFEISESVDINSVDPSKNAPNGQQHPPVPLRVELEQSESVDSETDANMSYRPDSFKTSDFSSIGHYENGYDSRVLTFLPSASTEATDLDEVSDLPRLDEVDMLMGGPTVRKPSTSNSPESGLFTLAVIDEEEDLDLEDQIKSINLSANF